MGTRLDAGGRASGFAATSMAIGFDVAAASAVATLVSDLDALAAAAVACLFFRLELLALMNCLLVQRVPRA
jgi:hypothetical protein